MATKKEKEERPILMETVCPFCKKKALIHEFKSRKAKGLYLRCNSCETTTFSAKGLYQYLSKTYPMTTTLKEMTYTQWNEYRKKAE